MKGTLSLLVAAAAAAALLPGCAAVAEGKHAPPVQGADWIRAPKDADRQLANRWGLVVFFRTGSATCAAEMPAVLELHREFGPKGLVTVGVTPADREDATAFADANGMTFPILTDARRVIDSWGIVEINELHTYLVDANGVVIAQQDLAKAREVLGKYMVAPKAK